MVVMVLRTFFVISLVTNILGPIVPGDSLSIRSSVPAGGGYSNILSRASRRGGRRLAEKSRHRYNFPSNYAGGLCPGDQRSSE